MSSFDRARAAGALFMALGLGGCFQPLYGEAAHPGLVDDLRAVEVAPIKDRIGHYLGDDLISNLNGSGETPTAKYRLTVTVTQNSQTPTISSQINAATSATVTGKATFTLMKIEGEKILYKGDATAPRSTTALWTASPISGPAATRKSGSPARWPTKSNCASPRRSARSADRRAGERRFGAGVATLRFCERRDAAPFHRP